MNVALIGLSIDSIYAHIAWLRTINEKIKWNGLENIVVNFPVIEDIKMEVANKFGMIAPSQSTNQAVRAVFFIDPNAKIRTILYYPASLERNFYEIRRIVQGLQKADEEGIATPANWCAGDDVIISPPGSCGVAKEIMETKNNDIYCLDWFMCFFKKNNLKIYIVDKE